jgi:hypothetical protein
MTAALSEHMTRALAAIKASGGLAIPEGGGWWKGGNGERLTFVHPEYQYPLSVQTATIYALVTRNLLARKNFDRAAWRDTYEVVP